MSRNRGEIATTLTIISLGVILVGTLLGSQQVVRDNVQKYLSNAQTTECNFDATNEIRDTSGQVIRDVSGLTWENSYGNNGIFPPNGEATYSYNPRPLPAEFRDQKASVTLGGLPTVYGVVDTFCESTSGSCSGVRATSDKMRIENLTLSCGGKLTYGWIVDYKPTGGSCKLNTTSCLPRNVKAEAKDDNEVDITWDPPRNCPSFNRGSDTYWIDVIDKNNKIVCSDSSTNEESTCKLDRDKERRVDYSLSSWKEDEPYIVSIYTHNNQSNNGNACVGGPVKDSFTYIKKSSGGGGSGSDASTGFNTFALNVWNSDLFKSPGDNHLCWSVGNNAGNNNVKTQSFSDYVCNGRVNRDNSGKVASLSICYQNKTGTTARVGWQVHRCKDNSVNCVQENTSSNGDRVEEAGDLKKIQNGKWYSCTWDVSHLKNPYTIPEEGCTFNTNICDLTGTGGSGGVNPTTVPQPTSPVVPTLNPQTVGIGGFIQLLVGKLPDGYWIDTVPTVFKGATVVTTGGHHKITNGQPVQPYVIPNLPKGIYTIQTFFTVYNAQGKSVNSGSIGASITCAQTHTPLKREVCDFDLNSNPQQVRNFILSVGNGQPQQTQTPTLIPTNKPIPTSTIVPRQSTPGPTSRPQPTQAPLTDGCKVIKAGGNINIGFVPKGYTDINEFLADAQKVIGTLDQTNLGSNRISRMNFSALDKFRVRFDEFGEVNILDNYDYGILFMKTQCNVKNAVVLTKSTGITFEGGRTALGPVGIIILSSYSATRYGQIFAHELGHNHWLIHEFVDPKSASKGDGPGPNCSTNSQCSEWNSKSYKNKIVCTPGCVKEEWYRTSLSSIMQNLYITISGEQKSSNNLSDVQLDVWDQNDSQLEGFAALSIDAIYHNAIRVVVDQNGVGNLTLNNVGAEQSYPIDYPTIVPDTYLPDYYSVKITNSSGKIFYTGLVSHTNRPIIEGDPSNLPQDLANLLKAGPKDQLDLYLPYFDNAKTITFNTSDGKELLSIDLDKEGISAPIKNQNLCGNGICDERNGEDVNSCRADCQVVQDARDKVKAIDVNGDKVVNAIDFGQCIADYGKTGDSLRCDIDKTHKTDALDISIIIENLGRKVN